MTQHSDLRERLSANSSFHGLLQTTWDNTSMAAFKTCPRYYHYSIMWGWRPRVEAVDLVFGLHYHSAIEFYDRQQAQGASHLDGLLATVRHCLQQTWLPRLDGKGQPWRTGDSYKNRWTLLRLVIWYLDQHRQDDALKTIILANGQPAVELSFAVELEEASAQGQHFRYAGHIDRLVDFQGEPWITDHKTTKSELGPFYFQSFTPGGQFSGYTFGARVQWALPVRGVIVEGAQTLVESARFQRGIAQRSTPQLEEWLKGTILRMREAEGYAEEGFWPMNEESCGRYRGCSFRGICSRSPTMREEWLEREFEQRVWDPLRVRGEA